MTEVDLSEAISHGVVVRPGGHAARRASATHVTGAAWEFKQELAGHLPDGADCVVMAGVEQLAVYRPENPEG